MKPSAEQSPQLLKEMFHRSWFDRLLIPVVIVFTLIGIGVWWASKEKEVAPATEQIAVEAPVDNETTENVPAEGQPEVLGARTDQETEEVLRNVPTNPSVSEPPLPVDTDNDELPDHLEPLYQTTIGQRDTDRDGFSDGQEVERGFHPTDPRAGSRMTNLVLVEQLMKKYPETKVISSGLSMADKQRYYLMFDGVWTRYFRFDGAEHQACPVGTLVPEPCKVFPFTLQIDFSRSLIDGEFTDSYHVPF